MVMALACGGFERGKHEGGGAAGGDSGAAGSFASAHAVLMSRCNGCHGPGGPASGTPFTLTGDAATDFATVEALVTPGDPAASLLLQKASGQGHGGGTVMTQGSADYNTIADWIAGGAQP